MKNEKLYKDNIIEGWPCHFFTMKAVDYYNAFIYKECQKVPENSNTFSRLYEIRRRICINVLNVLDIIWDNWYRGNRFSAILICGLPIIWGICLSLLLYMITHSFTLTTILTFLWLFTICFPTIKVLKLDINY